MVRKIRVLTIGLTLIPSIVLALINYTYGLGFLLGGVLSAIGFEMIVYTSRNAPLNNFKGTFKRNRVFRYLIYIVIIFIAIYFRNVFNLVCFIIAVSVNKIAIVLANRLEKGGDKNNDFDI
jgi:F0F1-type ATP synthase assembly protein I